MTFNCGPEGERPQPGYGTNAPAMADWSRSRNGGGQTDDNAITPTFEALRFLFEEGRVVELRALGVSTANWRAPHTVSGYYDDFEQLARDAMQLDGAATGIYITLNELNPALLARSPNEARGLGRGDSTTSDADVVRRRWLPIDFDPIRPSGISSSDEEHELAIQKARNVHGVLTGAGWSEPILADSGNGAHLLYRVDLPADDDELVKHVLEALASHFDSDRVTIDRSVHNPARIWKLYGTTACKGADTPDRPHRRAAVLNAPDKLEVVSPDLLQRMAGTTQRAPQSRADALRADRGQAFDLSGWIEKHQLDVEGPTDWTDRDGKKGKRWVFRVCPWNEAHTNGSAFIIQFENGAIAAGCHHDSCVDRDWRALRDVVEPGWREGRELPVAVGEHTQAWVDAQALIDQVRESQEVNRVYDSAPLLAQLSAAEYAQVETALRQLPGVDLRVQLLRRAIKEARDAAMRADMPEQDCPYAETADGIIWHRLTLAGLVPTPLTNFTARITTDLVEDDGVEERRVYEIDANLNGRSRRVRVLAKDFDKMDWVAADLGAIAIVFAGTGIKDHARAAIQLMSGDVPQQQVYTHTGWRRIDGNWCYLHGGGAIGKGGPVYGVSVRLTGSLARYGLPDPPEGDVLKHAVRASLGLVDLMPDPISYSLFSGTYRAAIGGDTDFAIHVAGATGVGKSEEVALHQQHYGPGMDRAHLPGAWSSTANTNEALAFGAKDALFVIDDFAPHGTTYDVQRMHRDADRLFRAQGNVSGRGRMWADGTLREVKPPRGLIISTGEDIPHGQSLRARMMVLEMSEGDLKWGALTQAQADARNGVYAQSMAGFLKWLAPQYDELQTQLRDELAQLRQEASQGGEHRRTPEIVANLAVGLRYFLRFAVDECAVTEPEADALYKRGWGALGEAAAEQARFQAGAEPAGRFLELLISSIASGRAHVAGPDGGAPRNNAEAWGWRAINSMRGAQSHQALGDRVGWVDGDDLYLDLDAAYAAAHDMGNRTGDALHVAPHTLAKRLAERGLLASTENRGGKRRLVVRRQLEGRRRYVLHLIDRVCLDVVDVGHSVGHKSGGEPEVAQQVAQDKSKPSSSLEEIGPLGPLNNKYRQTSRGTKAPDGRTGEMDGKNGADGANKPLAIHNEHSSVYTSSPSGPSGPPPQSDAPMANSTDPGDVVEPDDITQTPPAGPSAGPGRTVRVRHRFLEAVAECEMYVQMYRDLPDEDPVAPDGGYDDGLYDDEVDDDRWPEFDDYDEDLNHGSPELERDDADLDA